MLRILIEENTAAILLLHYTLWRRSHLHYIDSHLHSENLTATLKQDTDTERRRIPFIITNTIVYIINHHLLASFVTGLDIVTVREKLTSIQQKQYRWRESLAFGMEQKGRIKKAP